VTVEAVDSDFVEEMGPYPPVEKELAVVGFWTYQSIKIYFRSNNRKITM